MKAFFWVRFISQILACPSLHFSTFSFKHLLIPSVLVNWAITEIYFLLIASTEFPLMVLAMHITEYFKHLRAEPINVNSPFLSLFFFFFVSQINKKVLNCWEHLKSEPVAGNPLFHSLCITFSVSLTLK